MGDISDGLIDGTFDSLTGEYIGEGPGYPRTISKGVINSYAGGTYAKKKRKRKRFDDRDNALDFAKKVNGHFNDLTNDPKSKSKYSVTYKPK